MPEPLKDPCAFILLAAGNSTRMGSPKQLLDFGGKPLLRHAAENALLASCKPVVVVLGAHATSLIPVLSGLDVLVVINERWAEGMGTSIQAGVRALGNAKVSGVVLALADQPLVTSQYLRGLVTQFTETRAPVIASRYSETVGVPALFRHDRFSALLSLRPDQGCKGLILGEKQQAVFTDCLEASVDLDTPEDYRRVIANPA